MRQFPPIPACRAALFPTGSATDIATTGPTLMLAITTEGTVATTPSKTGMKTVFCDSAWTPTTPRAGFSRPDGSITSFSTFTISFLGYWHFELFLATKCQKYIV